MSVIRDLKPDINEMGWLEGKFNSQSLFQGEMDIIIFDETDEAKEYAEKCIEHYNSLNDDQRLLDEIQEKLSAVDVEQLFDRFYTVETARHSFQKAKPAGKKD